MSTNFPTSIDNFTNPVATDAVATVDHASQHSSLNDAVEALEAKVGQNSSAVTTSHDYKLSLVTGTDKAIGGASPTITTPTIASFVNATHSHANAAGGGTLDAAAIASGTIGTARLGSGSANSTTYLRGDQSWQTITTGAVSNMIMPKPVILASTQLGQSLATLTQMRLGRVFIDSTITVATVRVNITSFVSNGTLKIGLYSYDGSTQVFNVTSPTITGTGLLTSTLSVATSVSAGQYYLAMVAGSGSFSPVFFDTDSAQFSDYSTYTGKAVIEGVLTVSSGTLPSTITPSAITSTEDNTPAVRFDA